MANDIQAEVGVGADVSGAVSDVEKLLTSLTNAISKAELLQKSLTFKPKLDGGFLEKDIEKTLQRIESLHAQAGAKGVRTARAEQAVDQPKDRRATAVLDAQGREINRINADLDNVATKVIDHFTKTIERRFTTNMEAVEARINSAFQKSLTNVGVFGGRSQSDLSQQAAENVAAARQRQVNQSNRVAPIVGLSTEDIRARSQRTLQEQAERDNLARDIRLSRLVTRGEFDNENRDRLLGRTLIKAEFENEARERRLANIQVRAEYENELRDKRRARLITIAERDNDRLSGRTPATAEDRAREANRITLARLNLDGGLSFLAVQGRILANYVLLNSAYQAFTATISGVVELEKELKQFQAITQTSNTEMASFEKRLLTIASSSKFSAVEVAQAATTMGQAGLSAKQVGESLQAVINLATASGSTLKESVDVVTSVLGVFNLNATEAARIANVLTSGLNLSKLTMDKLALGLQYAGNVAHDAGLSFTELTATLGGLANSGIRNGSTLGTGVRQVLLDLQNPSEKFKKVMQELGITLADVDIKSNGLTGVFENLAKKGFGPAEALRSFETRAVAAFSAIANNLDTIKSFESQMLLTSAATEAASKQMESLGNTWSRFVSGFVSAAYTGFKPVLGFLQGIVGTLADLSTGMAKFPVLLQAVTTALAVLAGSAAINSLINLAGGLRLLNLGSLVASATSVGGLTAGLTTLLSAINPVVLGLGALSLAYVGIRNLLPEVAERIDRVNAKINEAKGRHEQTRTTISSLNEAIDKLYQRQQKLREDPAALANAVTEAREAFSKFGLQLDKNVTSVEQLIEAYSKLRKQQLQNAPGELRVQQRAEQEKLDLEKSQLSFRLSRASTRDLADTLGAGSFSSVRSRAQQAFGPVGNDISNLFSNPKGGTIEQVRAIESELSVLRQNLQRQIDEQGESADLRKKIDLIDSVIKLIDDRFAGILSRIRQGELNKETLGNQAKVASIQALGASRNPSAPGDFLSFSALQDQINKATGNQTQNLHQLLDRKNDSGAIDDFRTAQRSASVAADSISQQIDQFGLRLKREGFADKDIETAVKPLRDKVAALRSLMLGDLANQTEAFVEAQRKVNAQASKTLTHELAEIEKRASQARTPQELDKIFDEAKAKRGQQAALSEQDIELQFAKDKDFNERKLRLEELGRQTAADLKKTTEDFAQKNQNLVKKAFDDLIHEIDAQIKAIGKKIDEIKNGIRDQHLTGAPFDAATKSIGDLREQSSQLERRKSELTVGRDSLDRSYSVEGASSRQSALIRAAEELGISPRDLAAAISYETRGTFDPGIRGGKNNRHIGLIQFGDDEQKQFGANQNQTFEEQMSAVVKYLRSRGLKPGSGIDEIYRTINGGNPNANLNASDGNGTIAEHIAKIKRDHGANADAFLAGTGTSPSERAEAQRQAGLEASRKKEQADLVDDAIKNLDRKLGARTSTADRAAASTLAQGSRLKPDEIVDTTLPRVRKIYDDLEKTTVETINEEIKRRKEIGASTTDLEEKLQKAQEDIGSKRQAALSRARAEFETAAHKELDQPVKEAEKRLQQLRNGGEQVDSDRVVAAEKALQEAQRQRSFAEVDVKRRSLEFTQQDQTAANQRGQSQTAAETAAISKQLNEVTQQRIALEQSGLLTDQQNQALKQQEADLSRQLTEAKERERDGTREQQDAANAGTSAQKALADAAAQAAANLKAVPSSAGQFAQAGVNSFLRSNNVLDKDGNQLSFIQSMAKETQSILSSISSKFADTFTGILTGTKKGASAWKAMLASMLTDLTRMFAQKAFSFLISGLFGGGGGAGGSLLGGLFGGGGGSTLFKAHGGMIPGIKRYAQGVITRDSVPAFLQPGEAVLRKSAVSMVGEEGLKDINNLGNRRRSEANIQMEAPTPQQPQPFNFWLVQKDQLPTPGPRDMVHAVSQDILTGGQMRQLIKQVVVGQI